MTPGRTRGEVGPNPAYKIVPVRQKATKAELLRFKKFWVNGAHTQVWAVTEDEELAKRFREYRAYVRDSVTGAREYEVVFDLATVPNALWLIEHA